MSADQWSIVEVARMSGVTSRTLRHYDEIGLLRPARIGSNGYRHYTREELLRLQEILLLRELGLPLASISGVVDGRADRLEALRAHREGLADERHRLGRLLATVNRTIADLEGSAPMSADELFEGFAQRQAEYEEELVEQHGEGAREAFTQTRERTAGWGKDDYLAAEQEWARLEARVVALLRDGAAAADPRVQDVMTDHYASITRFWTPNKAAYIGVGQTYVDDPRFRERYDAQDPRLAEYLRDAIRVYAESHLD